MQEGIQFLGQREGLFGPDRLSEALRGRIREVIWTLVEAELAEVLAAQPYERKGERRGYRNGKRERSISTGLGQTVIELPRARLRQGAGEKEWQSRLVERYQRRARSVDSALLGCYLSGANGRRIRGALSPLLRGAPLSKSAISRIVGRLQALFTEWRKRSLNRESVVFLYLDAIALRVRIANRVVAAPVLVALGVKADGQKAVLDLELLQSESGECWGGFVEGLVGRGLKRPRLVIIDGNKGLRVAVDQNWPGIEVQRCTVHKLRNLERHTPRHALEEVKSDYHGIIRPSLWNKRGKFTENLS
jgi:putative transposase